MCALFCIQIDAYDELYIRIGARYENIRRRTHVKMNDRTKTNYYFWKRWKLTLDTGSHLTQDKRHKHSQDNNVNPHLCIYKLQTICLTLCLHTTSVYEATLTMRSEVKLSHSKHNVTLEAATTQDVNRQHAKYFPNHITSVVKHLYMGLRLCSQCSGLHCVILWWKYSMACWDLSRLQDYKV